MKDRWRVHLLDRRKNEAFTIPSAWVALDDDWTYLYPFGTREDFIAYHTEDVLAITKGPDHERPRRAS